MIKGCLLHGLSRDNRLKSIFETRFGYVAIYIIIIFYLLISLVPIYAKSMTHGRNDSLRSHSSILFLTLLKYRLWKNILKQAIDSQTPLRNIYINTRGIFTCVVFISSILVYLKKNLISFYHMFLFSLGVVLFLFFRSYIYNNIQYNYY